jgi:hypothetical protein
MKSTTSGIEVDFEPDTEDIEILPPAISDLADQWDLLADVYSKGDECPACMWHESGWNAYTNRRWRECSAFAPSACPAINPRSIANALRRQAT